MSTMASLLSHSYDSNKDPDYKTSTPNQKSSMEVPNPLYFSYLITEETRDFVFLFLSLFFVTSFPDFSICPIVGRSFRLISDITKISSKIYYAQVNQYFRQIFSKRCR